MVRPAPAVFSTRRRVSDFTARSAAVIAFAIRFAAFAGVSSPAEPGWKQTEPAPRSLERSSSLVSPPLARAHFSGSGVATLST